MTSVSVTQFKWRHVVLAALPILLAGCALSRPPTQVEAPTPVRWHAAVAHGGQVAELEHWWERQGDAPLASLIHAAQSASPDVAQAQSRLIQARSQLVAARAALMPTVDAQGSASRGFNQQAAGLATTAQIGVQAGWELDLFGRNAAGADAARERAESANAQWHDARVSVAAEVALQYYNWRFCTQQLAVLQSDTTSRGETAKLSSESERAGFTSPANAALANASFSDGKVRATQQQLQCDIGVKTLVVLTGIEEDALRDQLAATPLARAPREWLAVDSVPAKVLQQRPDVYAAEREVAAASADVGAARAAQYPQLSLGGSIGRMYVGSNGMSGSSNIWSIGPLAVSLPIFDAGRRAAEVDSAKARYEAAVKVFHARARQAVGEVEQALTRLANTSERSTDAERAAVGYRRSLEATQALWRGGLASQLDLENTRRTALASELALVGLEQERMAAWIQLYRAVGGGWDMQVPDPLAQSAAPAVPVARTP